MIGNSHAARELSTVGLADLTLDEVVEFQCILLSDSNTISLRVGTRTMSVAPAKSMVAASHDWNCTMANTAGSTV